MTGRAGRRSRLLQSASLAVGALGALSPLHVWAQEAPIRVVVAPPQRAVPPPRNHRIELVVPLRERGPLGQISIAIEADNSVRVRGADLVAALSRIIKPEFAAKLAGLTDSEGFIPTGAVEPLGMTLRFDPGLAEIAVTLPVEARQRQTIGLGWDYSEDQGDTSDTSDPIAVYLNYRATLDYVHVAEAGEDTGLQSPRVDFDLNGRIKPFAFENQFTYDDDNTEQAFRRGGSRLIYDRPQDGLRFTAGDLYATGTGFQSTPDIAGVSVGRFYNALHSDRVVAARSSSSITLREASSVEIRVNGAPVRTLRLEPGQYDIRDLPLTQGANAVELVIRNDSGAQEVVSFDLFSDSTLLTPGADEFYAGAGVRAPRDSGEIEYETDEPIFTGYYRRGLSTQLTAGGSFQADSRAQMISGEAVFGTPLGLSNVNLALSNREHVGSGYALRAQHRWTQDMPTFAGQRSLDVSAETRSRRFGAVDTEDPNNDFALLLGARYSQPFSDTWSGSLGADYSKGRDGREDRYGAQAFASWSYNFATVINFGATYDSGALTGDEGNLFVNFTRRIGERSTVAGSVESRNGRTRASYSRAPLKAIDDFGLSVDAVRSDEDAGMSGALTYYSNRGELEAVHTTTFSETTGDISDQRTTLGLYGSVALAGSSVGFGRPIYDSFALVHGHPSLDGRQVLIQGLTAEEATARSGLGPALVPLGSYSRQTVPYDVKDLPPGYDLGAGAFDLFPWHHSGFNLEVGSAYNVTVIGTLVDTRGAPAALRAGVAELIGDAKAPKVDVVTNRTGRFGVSGLAPGRWRIVLRGEPALTYDVLISDASTLFRAGELRPTDYTGSPQ